MTWTALVDRTTGTLVTAAMWNAMLGVSGNLSETAAAKVTTAGDLVYASGANALQRLALSTAGRFLRVNSGATAPEWGTLDDLYPWRVAIFPAYGDDGNTNWSSSSVAAGAWGFGGVTSTGAQNAEITFNVTLAAGTYQMWVVVGQATDYGRYHFYVNGVSHLGTYIAEGYNTTPGDNFYSTSGISVTVSGKTLLTFKMETKHGSSSSYIGRLRFIHLRRTA